MRAELQQQLCLLQARVRLAMLSPAPNIVVPVVTSVLCS